MTLKDFKARFVPGRQVLHVSNVKGPVNEVRTVDAVQTNGVWFQPTPGGDPRRPWMIFPKAAELTADETGFTLHLGPGLTSVYQWVA